MQQETQPIVCKPTPWFAIRAVAMLAMFSVFSLLFYIDGTTGYRKKNLEYHLHAAFQKAAAEFKAKEAEGGLTPEAWKQYAEKRTVDLPADTTLVPAGDAHAPPLASILADYDRMKPGQPHLLWQTYSGENEMSAEVAEKPHDAGKIREQIHVFYICLSLALITLFLLVRTVRRSVAAHAEHLVTADGKRIPYSEMRTLDLRKWDTKGIAFIEYGPEDARKRARIDGLTYGGFKKEDGEPAERLMQRIRSRFSGEIIEYAAVEPEKESPGAA